MPRVVIDDKFLPERAGTPSTALPSRPGSSDGPSRLSSPGGEHASRRTSISDTDISSRPSSTNKRSSIANRRGSASSEDAYSPEGHAGRRGSMRDGSPSRSRPSSQQKALALPKTRSVKEAGQGHASALSRVRSDITNSAQQEEDEVRRSFERVNGTTTALVKQEIHARWAVVDEEREKENKEALLELQQSTERKIFVPGTIERFYEEQRASNFKLRNLRLCREYVKDVLPQPWLYRGIRGIDYLYGSKQANHKPDGDGDDSPKQQTTAEAKKAASREELAYQILSQTTFFQDLEKTKEGIIEKLAKVAVFKSERSGQVIFREGDAAYGCWIIKSGSVSVYIRPGDEYPPSPRLINDYGDIVEMTEEMEMPTWTEMRNQDEPPSETREPSKSAPSKSSTGPAATVAQKTKQRLTITKVTSATGLAEALPPLGVKRSTLMSANGGGAGIDTALLRRDRQFSEAGESSSSSKRIEALLDEKGRHVYKTCEGFGTFTEESDLGKIVATLTTSNIFGEVALLNDAPRNATIRCADNCEFLVVKANSFRKVLKDFVDVGKALNVLRDVEMFANMEAATPGVIPGLAANASFVSECKGQAIFREGDTGKGCFVVIKGQVGVFIRKKDKKQPKTPRHTNGEIPTLSEWRRSGREDRDKAERSDNAKHGLTQKIAQGFRTTEGFSTFSEESTFGERVTLLPAGSLFGELALQNDAPRAASIVCTQDCELLVLRKQDYLESIESRLEKVNFFDDNAPGLKKYLQKTGGLPIMSHPSVQFFDVTYEDGHPLFMEGIAIKPMLVLVGEGHVEFRRFLKPGCNPAYTLADRPQSAPTEEANEFNPVGKRPAVFMKRSASDVVLRSCVTSFPPEVANETELVETLGPGGFFGSMGTVPLRGMEPFTVVCKAKAGAKCKLYIATGSALSKLPAALMQSFKTYLAKATRERLLKVQTTAWEQADEEEASKEVPLTPPGGHGYQQPNTMTTEQKKNQSGWQAGRRRIAHVGHFKLQQSKLQTR